MFSMPMDITGPSSIVVMGKEEQTLQGETLYCLKPTFSSCQPGGRRLVRIVIVAVFTCYFGGIAAHAADLTKPTAQAFDKYIQAADARMTNDLRSGDFFWIDALPAAERADDYNRLRNGEILVKPVAVGMDVPGGMINDCMGIMFIRGATVENVWAVLQDYNAAHEIYGPEVTQSKVLMRTDDGHFRIFERLKKHVVTTVVLDVVNDVQYSRLGPLEGVSHSQSVRVTDVMNPGTPEEYEKTPGHGHGYLWRMDNYGHYRQDATGVYVQSELIALSRGIPYGFAWLIKPLARNLPGESLTLTLSRTRNAVEADSNRPRASASNK
jgi:hypothetical protein